jgi:hypothetical protein
MNNTVEECCGIRAFLTYAWCHLNTAVAINTFLSFELVNREFIDRLNEIQLLKGVLVELGM